VGWRMILTLGEIEKKGGKCVGTGGGHTHFPSSKNRVLGIMLCQSKKPLIKTKKKTKGKGKGDQLKGGARR